MPWQRKASVTSSALKSCEEGGGRSGVGPGGVWLARAGVTAAAAAPAPSAALRVSSDRRVRAGAGGASASRDPRVQARIRVSFVSRVGEAAEPGSRERGQGLPARVGRGGLRGKGSGLKAPFRRVSSALFGPTELRPVRQRTT